MPAALAELPARLDSEQLLRAMRHDKKSSAGSPRFVLIERPGAIRIDVECEVPTSVFLA